MFVRPVVSEKLKQSYAHTYIQNRALYIRLITLKDCHFFVLEVIMLSINFKQLVELRINFALIGITHHARL